MKSKSGITRVIIAMLSSGLLLGINGCSSNLKYENAEKGTGSLPALSICQSPNPQVPSSAFNFSRSESQGAAGYWVNYSCKKTCTDWRSCLVPTYSHDNGKLLLNGRQPSLAKQSLAFVVDGMAGHIALSSDGEKNVFIHTGAGGTRYYAAPAETLEKMSSARTVMMRWEKGYVSETVQSPFTSPVAWGWYSRSSAEKTNIKDLNKRVASVIAWSHDNLSKDAMFGTLGCSMGTNATFGPVLWHGLDSIIDYQLFVGGPNMWDLNTQCKRRSYNEGYCDYDGVTACRNDSDCKKIDTAAQCAIPSHYTTIDRLFGELPNHIHVTEACNIAAAISSTPAYEDFDSSSMAYSEGADWEIDHKMDFLVNLDAKQGSTRQQGLGGDEYWALGHFPPVYNKIKPDSNKSWRAIPNSHHCDAIFDEALEVIKQQMEL